MTRATNLPFRIERPCSDGPAAGLESLGSALSSARICRHRARAAANPRPPRPVRQPRRAHSRPAIERFERLPEGAKRWARVISDVIDSAVRTNRGCATRAPIPNRQPDSVAPLSARENRHQRRRRGRACESSASSLSDRRGRFPAPGPPSPGSCSAMARWVRRSELSMGEGDRPPDWRRHVRGMTCRSARHASDSRLSAADRGRRAWWTAYRSRRRRRGRRTARINGDSKREGVVTAPS